MKKLFTQISMTIALLMTPLHALHSWAQEAPTLYGTMVSSDGWEDSKEYGVYSFQAKSPVSFSKQTGSYLFNATAGAAYFNGKYVVLRANDYGEGVESVNYYEYSTDDWEEMDEDEEMDVKFMATDYAENPLTHQLYGVCSDGKGGIELAVVDFPNRQRTVIGALATHIATLAIDGTGTIYGIGANGTLYKISATDASLTAVGNTGIRPDVMQSMTFDWATGKLYWAASFEDDEEGPVSGLYEVNTENGHATRIARFYNNEQLVGLFCLNELAQWEGPDAPVAPGNLNIDYTNKVVTLSWDAPTAGIHNGEVDFSKVTYTVVRHPDEVTVATGLTTTSFTETLDPANRAAYYYEVTAYADSLKGGSAESASVIAGDAVEVPYEQTFDDGHSFALLTMVDGDGDGETWTTSVNSSYAVLPGAPFEYTNDWMMTPAIRLQADRLYKLSFRTWAAWAGNYPYNVKACVGKGNDMEDMTQEITARSGINDPAVQILGNYFRVSETGNYNIGINAYGVDIQNVCLDSIMVEAGPMLQAPDSVALLKATADATGAAKATVSFTTPDKTIGGDALAAITKVDIFRDGTLIQHIDNPTAGTAQSIEDRPTKNNCIVSYRVVAYDEAGEGLAAETSVYVGEDTPAAPTNVRLEDKGAEAVLTWDIPTKGVHGGYVNTAQLMYGVIDNNNNVVANPLRTNSYECPLGANGEQTYLFFGVAAYNGIGQSAITVSNPLVAGKPYSLPFKETFAGGQRKYFWGVTDLSEGYSAAYWQINDGSATFNMGMTGNRQHLFTGKISLKGSTNPVLEYDYIYRAEEGNKPFNVYVVKDGRDTVLIDQHDYTLYMNAKDFEPARVELKNYKNTDYIQILFDGYAGDDMTMIQLRNITVRDYFDYDVATDIEAPETVKSGDKIAIKSTVSNIGAKAAEDYTVDLYEDGNLVKSLAGETLQPDEQETYTFDVEVNALKDELKYTVVANFQEDLSTENNVSDEKDVTVALPTYPTPTNAQATQTGSGKVEISWTSPEYANYAVSTTEDAEKLTPLSTTDLGEWTSIDGDKKPTDATIYVGWDELTFEHKGEALGFIVINPTQANIPYTNFWDEPTGWQPVSGNQLFASIGSNSGANNDWLISPELSGDEQTISFYVHGNQRDQYEVLYSTTDKDTTSFVSLGSAAAPTTWSKVSKKLPEGAKYFAIRNITDSYPQYLLIDDIAYTPLTGKGALTLSGYNIYCDGTLKGTISANVNSYTDNSSSEGSHTYQITAVYNLGESSADLAEVNVVTGIYDISTGRPNAVEYFTLDGKRVSAPQQGINIVRMSDGSVRKVKR